MPENLENELREALGAKLPDGLAFREEHLAQIRAHAHTRSYRRGAAGVAGACIVAVSAIVVPNLLSPSPGGETPFDAATGDARGEQPSPWSDAPPSDPVDELSQHDGEFCPPVLPRAPRETYGFGDDRPATTVPTLWKPQEAWICRYVARDVASDGSNGAWYEWVMQGAPRRLGAEELGAFSTAIDQLEPPSNTGCDDDLGPRYLVSYAYENDLTGVVIDDYGCHGVRLTDNPFRTVPGYPSQPGTVVGVLSGPTTLLSELNVG